MRVLVVGASGRLGTAVVAALGDRHEVVSASRSGEHFVDLTNSASIAGLYASVGQVDAVVCTAGKTPYGPLAELTSDQWLAGVRDKLLGQVELVRLGLPHVADGGSFTLVSGILSVEPVLTSAVASTVDGGIDAFVRSAAIELPRGLRINTVSATVFEEAWDAYGSMFPGATPDPRRRRRPCVRRVGRGQRDRPGVPGRLLSAPLDGQTWCLSGGTSPIQRQFHRPAGETDKPDHPWCSVPSSAQAAATRAASVIPNAWRSTRSVFSSGSSPAIRR